MDILQQIAEALSTGGRQTNNLPVRQPPQLMAPEDLPREDQLGVANTSGMPEFMGVGDSPPVRAEIPLSPGDATKLARILKAKLTGREGAFSQDMGRADIDQFKEFVPSAKATGSRRDVTGQFDEVPTQLSLDETDRQGLFRFLESLGLSEGRGAGGPGLSTLPQTFSRPQLLMDRLK